MLSVAQTEISTLKTAGKRSAKFSQHNLLGKERIFHIFKVGYLDVFLRYKAFKNGDQLSSERCSALRAGRAVQDKVAHGVLGYSKFHDLLSIFRPTNFRSISSA